ncbi:response regulator [Pseudanabaena sp. FACHB-1998]|uniref:response regulator n=1 Tax=Pseudanabaena sp. FACHB-1998 TaxID=2692858 RepID=UPI001680C1AC|nr:response regulator [Pseudanabaena sp. FACHB-1998]MBD2175771.1 response regulator [Pseudanabaena sp. FACHB-1998]
MSEPLNALLIEDSEDDALLTLRELKRGGFNVVWERVETAETLRTVLLSRPWDIVLSDYNLPPSFNAPMALEIVKQINPNLPFVVISGTIGEASAVELMRQGANDYLMKGKLIRLAEVVRRELREAEIRLERQQSALELARTKERLQLAIAGSGIGLWDWDVPSGNLIFNERWAEIIGYSIEELEFLNAETVRQKIHPDDLQIAILALEKHFRQEKETYECEMRMCHKLGGWVWVLASGKVVEWDKDGKPLRMTGTHLDISGRKQSVEMLQKLNETLEKKVQARTADLKRSENQLREAQQIAHLGSWELDVSTRKNSWSTEVFRIFRLDPDCPEPNYEEMLAYFPIDDRRRFLQLIDRAIQLGETFETDLQIICADGSLGYIFVKAEAIANEGGQVTRLFGILMDISDRKAIQEALKRSEERSRASLLALPDIVYRINSNSQYVDFLVSPQGKNLVDPQQVIGKSLYEVLPYDLAETQSCLMQQALATQTTQIQEQLVLLEGKPVHEEVRVAPCGNNEAVFFIRDISDRKLTELQLQQTNEELMRATRLKDEFLASMSHELRTPLNVILGMTEGLQAGVFGEVSDRQIKALQTVENSGNHLLSLINDILDVAKIESGQMILDLSATSVQNLCKSSIVFVSQLALRKQIQIIEQIPQNLPELLLDERRIRQVLINLLNNAVKFTEVGGNITLAVTLLSEAEYKEKPFLRIAIQDTGIGIAPEHIKKLFQPFIQIDSALNRKYEGTGLGLALVKRIVEMHHGTVSLTSELGVGSCFTIELPCGNAVLPTPKPESQFNPDSPLQSIPSTALAPPLILLAEDNEENILTISSYLEAKGYRIIVAKNGQEAIASAKSHQPDLILMDIQLPVMDGLEATKQIRLDPDLVDLPIIALTALAMEGDRDRCLAAGANEYISKPIKLKQLALLIQELL